MIYKTNFNLSNKNTKTQEDFIPYHNLKVNLYLIRKPRKLSLKKYNFPKKYSIFKTNLLPEAKYKN